MFYFHAGVGFPIKISVNIYTGNLKWREFFFRLRVLWTVTAGRGILLET
jgi:hypothetical protein